MKFINKEALIEVGKIVAIMIIIIVVLAVLNLIAGMYQPEMETTEQECAQVESK